MARAKARPRLLLLTCWWISCGALQTEPMLRLHNFISCHSEQSEDLVFSCLAACFYAGSLDELHSACCFFNSS
jgi:hypothetical protein